MIALCGAFWQLPHFLTEQSLFFYLGRLLSFSLIVVAIIDKNLGDTHEVARPQTETEKTLKICA